MEIILAFETIVNTKYLKSFIIYSFFLNFHNKINFSFTSNLHQKSTSKNFNHQAIIINQIKFINPRVY